MPVIAFDALVGFGVRLLVAKGASEDAAGEVARIAAETEAWGIPTHGMRIYEYFEQFIGKGLDPRRTPRVAREKGATALVDGAGAFGQLSMKLATDVGISKARDFGIAMVSVPETFWIAGLAVYMVPIVQAGLFGQLWVQHSSGKDCAPFGGIEPRFSTNPVALGFPTPDGGGMISDFSTSIIAMGKVGPKIRAGEKFDDDLFLDADGNLTDDPAAMRQGGSMLFFGGAKRGYKGFAMSLWAEALTAMSGGRTNDPDNPSRQAFHLTVIDPEAFAGSDVYLVEMKKFLARMKTSRLRPGFTEIRIPGERGLSSLADARTNGVPISDEMIASLNVIAAKHGVGGLG